MLHTGEWGRCRLIPGWDTVLYVDAVRDEMMRARERIHKKTKLMTQKRFP